MVAKSHWVGKYLSRPGVDWYFGQPRKIGRQLFIKLVQCYKTQYWTMTLHVTHYDWSCVPFVVLTHNRAMTIIHLNVTNYAVNFVQQLYASVFSLVLDSLPVTVPVK